MGLVCLNPQAVFAQDFKKNNLHKYITTDPNLIQTTPIRVGIGIGEQGNSNVADRPQQRLHIHETVNNLCPRPIGGGGGNGGNIPGGRQKLNNSMQAVDNQQIQEPQVHTMTHQAIDSLQLEIQGYLQAMDGFYAAPTPTEQETQGITVENKKAKVQGRKQKTTQNASTLSPQPSANLNVLIDTMMADFNALARIVESDIAQGRLMGIPTDDPCATPNSQEVYMSITTNTTGYQTKRGLDIGLYDRQARIGSYTGGSLQLAAIPRNLNNTPDYLRSAQLSLTPSGSLSQSPEAKFYFAPVNFLSLGCMHSGSPFNPIGAEYETIDASVGLWINPRTQTPLHISSSFTEIENALNVKGKFNVGTTAYFPNTNQAQLHFYTDTPNAGAIIESEYADLRINTSENRNVFIGSTAPGNPNLIVGRSISSLVGDITAAQGRVIAFNGLYAKHADNPMVQTVMDIESGNNLNGRIEYQNPNPQGALLINSQNNRNVVIGAATASDPADLIVHGNISIGTPVGANSPRFSVDGNAAIKGMLCVNEVRVRLNGGTCWPDYVFENGYQLMPLQELRNYVNTHKHLPGIPAAATVTDEGFAVGEMNRLLLEKVEELTRYILELDAKVKILQKENQTLQK